MNTSAVDSLLAQMRVAAAAAGLDCANPAMRHSPEKWIFPMC